MKVRDVLAMLKADGWYLVVTEGSHRQFKHRKKVDVLRSPESRTTIFLPAP
jgi:predicted RNA binding protein YcfA (HicA-like mRNA interferase family)